MDLILRESGITTYFDGVTVSVMYSVPFTYGDSYSHAYSKRAAQKAFNTKANVKVSDIETVSTPEGLKISKVCWRLY